MCNKEELEELFPELARFTGKETRLEYLEKLYVEEWAKRTANWSPQSISMVKAAMEDLQKDRLKGLESINILVMLPEGNRGRNKITSDTLRVANDILPLSDEALSRVGKALALNEAREAG